MQSEKDSITEYEQQLQQILEIDDSSTRFNELIQLAVECRRKGWGYDQIALEAFEASVQICQEKDDPETEALVWTHIIETCYPLSEWQKAITAAQHAVNIYRELNNYRGELETLLSLAQLYASKAKNPAKAIESLERVLEFQSELDVEEVDEIQTWLMSLQAEL